MKVNEDVKLMEKVLGVEHPSVTREQLQAAYALNLCSVSVSQIIDYNDVYVLEQEYDAILNNLNLENMPKDEALLDIIKRTLEAITFFRIQDGEKAFIEKDYQQKMKNAIWSAMPNPGALVATGLSRGIAGMAVSLAASVGTAYMNYRKNRSEYQLDKEKQLWELKKSAMEQFQALQQQLFETSWRLADTYNFPDALRLTEKQIKQYDAILQDTDDVRKFERLDAIKHKFAAYPPFWYYFGNTANTIAMSEHYGLDEDEKEVYRNFARRCFEYFSVLNKYDLLREDSITAACYLEYIDLLDVKEDADKIKDLVAKAVESAGNSLDVLQLCAIAYMKIGDSQGATFLLRQLVNEQYNEVTNAQLLSSIYVNNYIDNKTPEVKTAYRMLESRVCPEYLFPLPVQIEAADKEKLQAEFVKTQRNILKTKYKLVLLDFIRKYEAKINSIIPLPDALETVVSEDAYSDKVSTRNERIAQVKLALYGGIRSDRYRAVVQNIPYSYEVLDVLNKMFASICLLECVQDEQTQLELQNKVSKGIKECRENLEQADSNLVSFDESVYEDIQNITLRKLTADLFVSMAKIITESVDAKIEMSDFAIAEFNLVEFCKKEGISSPEMLFAHKDDAETEDALKTYFTPDLIGESTIKQNERINKNKTMVTSIKAAMSAIVLDQDKIEFYTQEDPRVNRYFYGKAMQRNRTIRSKTLAVLDDRSKGDRDLLFTTEGVMPVMRGKCKTVIPYDKIDWSKNSKKKELTIGGVKYSNDKLEMDKLYELIKKLAADESHVERVVIDN